MLEESLVNMPDQNGHFGVYGGQFVSETLMTAIELLADDYALACKDEAFQADLRETLAITLGVHHLCTTRNVGLRPSVAQRCS